MNETDHTNPENNLIPEDLQDQTFLDWLKALLKRAIEKLSKEDPDPNDPDTKTAKNLLKNVNKITQKIAKDKAAAVARGEAETVHSVDRALPEKVREYINDFNVGEFIEEHHEWMIPLVADVVEGTISPELFLVYASSELIHRTGADTRVAKIIAGRIRDKLKTAAGQLVHSRDQQDRDAAPQAADTIRQIEELAPDEPPKPEQPTPEKENEDGKEAGSRSELREIIDELKGLRKDVVESSRKEEGREHQEGDDDIFLDKYVYDEASLARRLGAGLSKDDLAWFERLKNPEAFAQHFANRMTFVIDKARKDNITLTTVQAQEAVSDEVTQFVMSSLVTIYSPILDEEPKEFFDKQAQNAGSYNDNPFSAARTFSKMLNNLRERSGVELTRAQREGKEVKVNLLITDNYRRLDRKTITVKDESSGQLVKRTMPSTEKTKASISEFAEYLREVFESAEDTIGYGHNFKLLTTLGPREGPRGEDPFFSQIAGLAKHFSSDKIDITFRLPYNDIVQAAKQKFQSSYARLFVEYQWQKDPDMLGRFLHSMPEAERRVKQELREQFSGKEIPDWALEWAFQTGRTMYFGVDFGFHEMVSFADPNLQYNGSESLTGLGFMRGYFDMWETAKMLNLRKGKNVAKAVYMPYDINMGDPGVKYDHKEWSRLGEGRWKESFTMGQAAYAGSFLDGHKLFIDMGNITGAGGWGTNSGWRMRDSYLSWLQSEFQGGTLRNLAIQPEYLTTTQDNDPKQGDLNTFVRAWKRVENIGIPITENLFKKYVIDKVDKSDKEERETNKPEFVAAVTRLGEFFYDRYFSDGNGNPTQLGEELLKEYSTKDAFLKHLNKILDNKDDHYEGSRPEELMSIMNKVSTVMTLEQMPAHFVMMEKQRMTEYGVTLLSEIQTGFLQKVGGNEEAAKKRADRALADLIYAQEKLRIDTSEKMEAYANMEGGNLYGDLTSLRSTILGDKGNVLTEEYIINALQKRLGYEDPSTAQADPRVQDVLAVYSTIHNRVSAKVTMEDILGNSSRNLPGNEAIRGLFEQANAFLKKEEQEHRPRKKRSKEEKELIDRTTAIQKKASSGELRSRAAWWAHALDNNYFGHAVTQPSVAMKFVNVSAAASDIVQRDAAQAANTSELLHKQSTLLYKAVKDAAEIGSEKGVRESYVPLEEWIGSFKTSIQDELGSEIAYEVDFRAAQIIDFFFKKDDATHELLGDLDYWATYKKRSLSDSIVDEGAPLLAWNHDAEAGWAHYLHDKGKLKRKPSKGHKHREIIQSRENIRSALRRIPSIGDQLAARVQDGKKEIPNYFNSFDYHSLQYWSNSGDAVLFRHHGFSTILKFLIGIGVIAVKKGSEDLE